MSTVNVQFDPTKTTVISVFGCPQDPIAYPDQETIPDIDPRYLAFINPVSTLAGAQSAQSIQVKSSCAAAIINGFQSSALGSPHTYPSGQTDQANLSANVMSSMYPNLPANWTTLQVCCDSTGKWAYLPHTAAQIQQAGVDGKAAILACLTKNAGLQAQIMAAEDVPSVQKVVW